MEESLLLELMSKYRITIIYHFQISGKWTLQLVEHCGQLHMDNTSGTEIHVSFRSHFSDVTA